MSLSTVPGLFTPQADVLCYTCHGPKWRTPEPRSDIPGYDKLCQPFESIYSLPNDCEITWCQKCGAQIALREDVAMLNNLRMELPRGWYPRLEQTGGMCVALSIEISNVLYTIYDNDSEKGLISIAMYPDPEECDMSIHVGVIDVRSVERVILTLVQHRFKHGARVQ